MTDFITVLAWIFGVLSTFWTILRINGWIQYQINDHQRLRDQIRGVHRMFPIWTSGTIMIISWTWIIMV